MKSTNLITSAFILILLQVISACQKDKNELEIIQDKTYISKVILGEWLLASSNSEEWTVYEFEQSQQLKSNWFVNKSLDTGNGMYFTNDEKSSLTGTINDGNNNYTYIDWIAKNIQAFQIDIDIYGGADGNQFQSSNSLYKIVGTQDAEYNSDLVIDYRKYTGTNECSEFTSMNESIVSVNSTGQIKCIGAGSTYVIFKTPVGHACIKINVSDKILTFAENIIGTWVTDVKGYVWERDVFGVDGYFYAQWSREIIYPTSNESSQGHYSINEANKTITVSAQTPYLQKINSEYRITKIDKFSFNTDIYSGGDKTGTFYYQRILSSITMPVNGSEQPNYLDMVGASLITGYSSHDEKIATVNKSSGFITGISKGITYIDVITNNGTGVIEVNVN